MVIPNYAMFRDLVIYGSTGFMAKPIRRPESSAPAGAFRRPTAADGFWAGDGRPTTYGAVYITNVTCAIGQGFRRGRVTLPYRAFDVCGKAYTFLQNPRDVELTPIW